MWIGSDRAIRAQHWVSWAREMAQKFPSFPGTLDGILEINREGITNMGRSRFPAKRKLRDWRVFLRIDALLRTKELLCSPLYFTGAIILVRSLSSGHEQTTVPVSGGEANWRFYIDNRRQAYFYAWVINHLLGTYCRLVDTLFNARCCDRALFDWWYLLWY